MRSHRAMTSIASGLALAACDVPTDAPIIEQRWILPLEVVSLQQSELLPPEVTVQGNAYDVDVADASSSESLGNLCPACVALNGLTVPTPAYQGTFVSTDNLPTDVVSVDVMSGSVDVTITNGLSFDPLAGGGTLTVTVAGASGGPVLGTLLLDGATDVLPTGVPVTRAMTLSGGTLTGAIETTIAIDHVGGVVTTIDVSEQVSLGAMNTTIMVASATVDVDGMTAQLDPTGLDVEDIGGDIVDGILSGTVVLDVANGYGVSFDGTLSIAQVTKSLSIPATPTSTVEITFTGAELQSFLGTPGVTIQGSGTIGGGPAVLTPADELTIDTTIDLIVELGG